MSSNKFVNLRNKSANFLGSHKKQKIINKNLHKFVARRRRGSEDAYQRQIQAEKERFWVYFNLATPA